MPCHDRACRAIVRNVGARSVHCSREHPGAAMSNLKAAVGEKEAAAIRKRLNTWAKSSNPTCADCTRTNPTWASVNLGVLVCLECAGRHRSLGTHISKMRSITLDTILPEEAQFLIQMTNALANRYWEASLPAGDRPRAIQNPHFVSQKYSDRRWALSDSSVPAPSIQCVPHSHPWWSNTQATQAAAPPGQPAAPARTQPSLVKSQNSSNAGSGLDLIDFGEEKEAAHGGRDLTSIVSSDPFGTATTAAMQPVPVPSNSDPFATSNAGTVPQAQAVAQQQQHRPATRPICAACRDAPARTACKQRSSGTITFVLVFFAVWSCLA